MRVNAMGYQDVEPLPDTRPSARRAADLLERSVTRNINDREARELEALQGIGFALLAIAEQMAERPQETAPEPRGFRLLRRPGRARP